MTYRVVRSLPQRTDTIARERFVVQRRRFFLWFDISARYFQLADAMEFLRDRQQQRLKDNHVVTVVKFTRKGVTIP